MEWVYYNVLYNVLIVMCLFVAVECSFSIHMCLIDVVFLIDLIDVLRLGGFNVYFCTLC